MLFPNLSGIVLLSVLVCDFCQKLPLAPKAVFVYHNANKTKKSELLKAPDEVGLGELR